MASLKLILTLLCLYFVLNYFPLICSAELTENVYGNQDLKFAIQKINELQKIVRAQDDRISTLEKYHSESKEHAVTDLQNLVKKQNNRIARLEKRIKELETVVKAEEYAPDAKDIRCFLKQRIFSPFQLISLLEKVLN